MRKTPGSVDQWSSAPYFHIMKNPRRNDLEELIRTAGSQRRLADALETTEETVSRWMAGTRGIPAYVSVVRELLDNVPRKDWPERWK